MAGSDSAESMNKPTADMSTDSAWEQWGRNDPYFGVFTNPIFRRTAMTEDAKRDFFRSGVSDADQTLAAIRTHIDPSFVPRKILDYGCGVGRLVVAFATMAEEVVGVDVSPSMLEEAQRNCDERQLRNVRLLRCDDDLSNVTRDFDLIHSCIVFQHIPVERGRVIFANLLRRLRPGGIAAIHLTYSKTRFESSHGLAPAASPAPQTVERPPSATAGGGDPEMQMNPYNMNTILFLMQSHGVQKSYFEFTDHGGELGVFLYFSIPLHPAKP